MLPLPLSAPIVPVQVDTTPADTSIRRLNGESITAEQLDVKVTLSRYISISLYFIVLILKADVKLFIDYTLL